MEIDRKEFEEWGRVAWEIYIQEMKGEDDEEDRSEYSWRKYVGAPTYY
jgi:hypothetical protein